MFQNSNPHQSLRANFAAQRIKDILDEDDRIHTAMSQNGGVSPYFNTSFNDRCNSMMETPRDVKSPELRFDLKVAQNSSTMYIAAEGNTKG